MKDFKDWLAVRFREDRKYVAEIEKQPIEVSFDDWLYTRNIDELIHLANEYADERVSKRLCSTH
jgi:uncharacterized membrane protein